MKKLIITTGIIIATVVTQAASVTWTMMQVQKSDGSGVASSYLAMVFDAATSKDDVIKSIKARDTSTLSTLANGWKQDTVSTSAGMLRSAQNGSYSAEDSFSIYLVLFDAKTVADANYYFMSAVNSGNINAAGSNATLAFGKFSDAMAAEGSSGRWVAIPEPTSGLLLLLGMAGLALKRKHV